MEEDETEQVCELCGNASMVEVAGALVCSYCGTQSQAYTEEAQDAFDTGPQARFKRTVKFKTQKRTSYSLDPKLMEIVMGYCNALQDTLYELVEIVEEEFGVGPDLDSVVRRLWLSTVMHSGVLDPMEIGERIARRREIKNEDVQEKDIDNTDRMILRLSLHKSLYPDTLLDVLLVALIYFRAPVTPMDLVGRAYTGELPYFRILGASCETRDPNDELQLCKLIAQSDLLGSSQMIVRAAETVKSLQLLLPAVNSEAIVQLYCDDLDLPQELCPSVLLVVDCLRSADLALFLSTDPFRNPWVSLMALLVIVIKILHLQPEQAQHTARDGQASQVKGKDGLSCEKAIETQVHSGGPEQTGGSFEERPEGKAGVDSGLKGHNAIPKVRQKKGERKGSQKCVENSQLQNDPVASQKRPLGFKEISRAKASPIYVDQSENHRHYKGQGKRPLALRKLAAEVGSNLDLACLNMNDADVENAQQQSASFQGLRSEETTGASEDQRPPPKRARSAETMESPRTKGESSARHSLHPSIFGKRWAKHRLKQICRRHPTGPKFGARPYSDLNLARELLTSGLFESHKPPEGVKDVYEATVSIFKEQEKNQILLSTSSDDENEDHRISEKCSPMRKLGYLTVVAAAYCWLQPTNFNHAVTNLERALLDIETATLSADKKALLERLLKP